MQENNRRNRRALTEGTFMTESSFYDHFVLDKPTRLGSWIAKSLCKQVYRSAEIEQPCSVLEIGPGRGPFADLCLQNSVEYSAVEPNRQMAGSLEKRGARIICETVPPLPALDTQFDAVVMINVLEHMNSMQDALQITAQIKDVLKPKGRLVICSPDYLNLRHNFFNCDFSHSYVTTQRRLEQLLANAGLACATSRFLAGPFSGIGCILVTALVSRLPFGLLSALFSNSNILKKLYKLQLTLSRKVLVIGEKRDS
jgi:phospholipid N-methyltransferase